MIEVVNLRSVRRKHAEFVRGNDRLLSFESVAAAEFVVAEVKRNPGFVPRSTGIKSLLGSVRGHVVFTRGGARVIARSSGVPHNLAIEQGAKRHIIRARRRRGSLRFVWHGTVMFRKSVNHPGNRPYYFLRSATYAAAHSFETRMRRGMDALAKRFSR